MMIKCNANKLAATAIAQGTGIDRPFINGVNFNGQIMTATTGHICTFSFDKDMKGDGKTYLITKKAQTALKKAKSDFANLGNGVLSVFGIDGTLTDIFVCNEIDGTFPDCNSVFPKGNLTPGCYLDQKILKLVSETGIILSNVSSGGTTQISIEEKGGDEMAHLVRYDNSPETFSIAMPMRGSKHDSLPEWIKNKKKGV